MLLPRPFGDDGVGAATATGAGGAGGAGGVNTGGCGAGTVVCVVMVGAASLCIDTSGGGTYGGISTSLGGGGGGSSGGGALSFTFTVSSGFTIALTT